MPYRRWARLLAIIGTSVLTLVVTLLALLQLPPVATWAVRRLITVLPFNTGYQLKVGRVSGDWLHRLALEDVRLIWKSRELARLNRLELGYDLRELRGSVPRLRELTVNGARAEAHREGKTWDLTSALKSSADTTKHGGGIRIENLKLRDVQLMAELSPDSVVRVRGLNLAGRDLVVGDTVLLALDQLNLGLSPPGSSRWFALATRGAITAAEFRFDPLRIQTEETRIAGRVVLPRNLEDPRLAELLDVRLQATPLALADLAAVVPAAASEGDLHLDASARGSGDGLVTAHLGGRLDEATFTLDGVAPLTKGKADYRLRGSMRRLDPARLYKTAPSGSLNGNVAADLRGVTLKQSGGRVELRLAPSRVAGNSIHRLGLQADIRNGSAAVSWRGTIEQGTLAGTGRIRPFDSVPEYRLRGTATDLPGSRAVARKLSGDSGVSALEVRFRLAGAGLSPKTARVKGEVVLTALPNLGEDPYELGHASFALARGRLQLNPELLAGGGTITARAVAQLGDTLTYEVRDGKIDRVDLARLGADTAMGPLSGRFSLRGRGTAPDHAVASLRLDLDELRYGSHRIEKLSGQARLVRGATRLAFGGALEGGRIRLEADARPFAQTKTFLLRTASLEGVDLGSFLGRSDLAGPVTLHATGSGRVRGNRRSVEGRVTVEPSRLGKLEVTSGSVDLTLNGSRLTYDGFVRTTGGRVALAGDGQQLEGVRSLAIRRGHADSIDLGTLMGRADLHTRINASFTAQLSGDSAATRQADLSLELLSSRINQAQLQGGRVRLNLNGDALQGELRLTGRDGELGAQLNGKTGKATQVHTTGTLRLERLARWTGRADADGRLESSFTLNAAGDSAGLLSLDGNVNAIGGIGDIRINSAHLALGPDSGGIRVDTLIVRSNVLALGGHGRIALRREAGPGTLRITGTTYNLAPLAPFIGDSISLDSASMALTLAGPAWRWRLDGAGQINRILAGGNLADRVTLRATAAIDSTHLSGMRGELRVKDAASGKMRIPEARLAARYDSLLTLDGDVALGDSARIVTALRATVQSDTMRATLQRLDLTQGDSSWALEQPAQLELRPRVAVDGFALRSGRHRIIVDGVYDPQHSSDIGVHITDLNLEALRSLGLVPIGGRLDGWLRLQGAAAEPTLQGKLGLGIRQSDGRETGRVQTEINWSREGLAINAATVPVRGGRLTVNGTLPWRLTLTPTDSGNNVGVTPAADTLALAVQADSFDLAVFNPLLPADAARDLRGRLIAKARVSGPVKSPRADGTLEVTGVAVALPPLGLSYRDGGIVGRLSGDELRIEQFQLLTDKKQSLTAQGVVRLRPFNDPALDLTAKLSNFRISNSSSLQAVASGDLRLQGTAAKPSLTGNLTMGRTDIIMGGAQTAVTVEKVELTPEDLRQLAREFGPAVLAQVHESPGLVDRFHLDLNLRLPNRVWFRRTTSPKAEIELSGRIRLRQDPGQPMQFFGKVEPVPGRGTLDVYGREFRLTGGDIRLNGPVDSTTLDVTAEYQVPTQGGPDDEGVVVDVAAKGHLDSLALEFTSQPDMSQDDILSYLVTGRPSSDNPLAQGSGGQSTGEMGAAVALGTLTGSLSTSAEKRLGLDVFQIKPEGVRGLTLTAGRYLGSSLFLSMNLPIQLDTRAQQAGYNLGPSFEVEYALQRWLRAKVEAGNVPPSFSLRSRYAY